MTNPVLSSEATLALTVVVVLGGVGFARWFWRPASSPDPWGREVEDALEREEALPLCPHCLAPQERETWFCAECGSSIGKYNNVDPYLYVFSLGDFFRNLFAGEPALPHWSESG
jgi:hypothetical protein